MSVSLKKGQKVSLAKDLNNGNALGVIQVGLGWDTGDYDNIDLDASCGMYGADKATIDEVWFRHLTSKCGSVKHSGDNRTGAGDGDDEVISVDLNKVPASVSHIVFTVNSWTGQRFTAVKNAFARIVDQASGKELCRYPLSVGMDCTALIIARLYRHNGEWKFAALGEPGNGRSIQDLHGAIKNLF